MVGYPLAFDSGLGELITRYITDPRQIRTSDNTVRHTAFKPPKSGRQSVYWISSLPEATIWNIADIYLAPTRGPISARADLNSLVVYDAELSIELTGHPHPRHADIVGWDLKTTKPRLQAIKLASSSTLRRR